MMYSSFNSSLKNVENNIFNTDCYNNFFRKKEKRVLTFLKKLNTKTHLQEKILESSKTFTTVAGGARMSTRIVSIVGNCHGILGLGLGKSTNRIKAHRLSFYDAKKKLQYIPLTQNRSLPLFTWGRFCSTTIKLYPVYSLSGLKVGGTARTILEFAGIKNITSVQLGSYNILNTAYVTFLALNLLAKKIGQLTQENNYYKFFFRKKLINSKKFFK